MAGSSVDAAACGTQIAPGKRALSIILSVNIFLLSSLIVLVADALPLPQLMRRPVDIVQGNDGQTGTVSLVWDIIGTKFSMECA